MNDDQDRFSSAWFLWAWIMVAFAFVATGVAVAGGVLSRSLVLDLVSFWPGLILAVLVAAALYPFHRGKANRLAAVLPLLLLSWLAATIALHAAGWSALPSAAADFTGPEAAGITSASVHVENRGFVRLTTSLDPVLYRVEMSSRSGDVGAPQALERFAGDEAQVRLEERPPDAWYRSAGWVVTLAQAPAWWVSVSAETVDVDLSRATAGNIEVHGAGTIALPDTAAEVPVTLDGNLTVTVPSGTPMVIVGEATVPATWTQSDGRIQSPEEGPGYVVEVTGGGTVVVQER